MTHDRESYIHPLSMAFTVILDKQRSLQDAMGWPNGKGMEGVRTNFLCLEHELHEALDEVHWKPHKAHLPEHGTLKNRDRFIIELTDALQFWANAATAFDVTAEELAVALVAKWHVNAERILDGEVTRAET
jgi:hypothetical protein